MDTHQPPCTCGRAVGLARLIDAKPPPANCQISNGCCASQAGLKCLAIKPERG